MHMLTPIIALAKEILKEWGNMNGTFTSELQKMRYEMDCQQGNQKSFSKKLYLSKMRRKEKRQEAIKAIGREMIRLMAAFGLLSVMAAIIVPIVFKSRGYLAIGGEWMAMIATSFIFWAWLGKNIKNG